MTVLISTPPPMALGTPGLFYCSNFSPVSSVYPTLNSTQAILGYIPIGLRSRPTALETARSPQREKFRICAASCTCNQALPPASSVDEPCHESHCKLSCGVIKSRVRGAQTQQRVWPGSSRRGGYDTFVTSRSRNCRNMQFFNSEQAYYGGTGMRYSDRENTSSTNSRQGSGDTTGSSNISPSVASTMDWSDMPFSYTMSPPSTRPGTLDDSLQSYPPSLHQTEFTNFHCNGGPDFCALPFMVPAAQPMIAAHSMTSTWSGEASAGIYMEPGNQYGNIDPPSVMVDSMQSDSNPPLEIADGRFKCPRDDCTKTFGQLHNASRHIKYLHKKRTAQDKEDRYCKSCNKCFNRPDALKLHISRKHTAKKRK